MKISTRSLVREFPKAKAAARKGQAAEIVDGNTGESFVLTAKPTKTFGELAPAPRAFTRARAVFRSGKASVAEFIADTEKAVRPDRAPRCFDSVIRNSMVPA